MSDPGDVPAAGSLPAPGQELGPYRIERELGRGGMGVVFEAIHPLIGQRVAVKLLLPERCEDAAVRRRILDEARALAAVQHEGLVRIFGVGERDHDGLPYLIMERLRGETLRERLRRVGRLPVRDALRIAWQVALPLCAMHRAGLLHRDLKPGNVMLVPDEAVPGGERAKVLDCGVARPADPAPGAESAPRPVRFSAPRPSPRSGTPRYMAPEQAAGHPCDGRADVYALGAVLHELLTGAPFPGAEAPPLRASVPEVPAEVEALLLRMLAPAPEMRRDMNAVAAQLAELLRPPSPEAPGESSTEDPPEAPHEAPQDDAPMAGTQGLAQSDVPMESRRGPQPQEGAPRSPQSDAPLAASPFIVHRPLDEAQQFLGRDALLRTLFGWWQTTPLTSVALLGPRMSGKTSLLRQLTHLSERRDLRPDQDAPWLPPRGALRLVLCDLEDPRLRREAGLLRLLAQRLALPEAAATDLDRFMEAAAEGLRAPTVILLDHLDKALRHGAELSDDLWDGLRALTCNYTGGRLAFAVAARTLPRELARSNRRSSSFFALFRTVSLGPLEDEAARALLDRSPLPLPPPERDWLLAESGRWPRLLQLGADHLLAALREAAGAPPGEAWRAEAARDMAAHRDPA